jgi:hypothetical protein
MSVETANMLLTALLMVVVSVMITMTRPSGEMLGLMYRSQVRGEPQVRP